MAAVASSTSTSSDEEVNLFEAADLDDVTKNLFFSDDDPAGANLSWSVPEKVPSMLTNRAFLFARCDKHEVPRDLRPVCAGDNGWSACQTPPIGSNALCVYSDALDAGLRFPLHEFYPRVLRHYRLAPSQLTPNSWTYMAAFVLLCKDAGVDPLLSAFCHFFTVCSHSSDSKPTGWHHFQPARSGRRLFTGNLPSWSGWKSRYFFLEPPSGMRWSCPVKWGKPRRAEAREGVFTNKTIEKLKQMGSRDLKSLFASHGHEMPVGDHAQLLHAVKAEAKRADHTAGAAAVATESACTGKRKSPTVSVFAVPVSVSAPAGPDGFRPIRAARTGGSSQGMCASDALLFWEAKAKAGQAAMAMVAKLEEELRLAKSWNLQFQSHLIKEREQRVELLRDLGVANQHNRYLKEENARLKAEHDADVARLKEDHAEEKALLKKELEDDNTKLREELDGEAARLVHEGKAMGWRDMRQHVLVLFPDLIKPEMLSDRPDCMYNDMGCMFYTDRP